MPVMAPPFWCLVRPTDADLVVHAADGLEDLGAAFAAQKVVHDADAVAVKVARHEAADARQPLVRALRRTDNNKVRSPVASSMNPLRRFPTNRKQATGISRTQTSFRYPPSEQLKMNGHTLYINAFNKKNWKENQFECKSVFFTVFMAGEEGRPVSCRYSLEPKTLKQSPDLSGNTIGNSNRQRSGCHCLNYTLSFQCLLVFFIH